MKHIPQYTGDGDLVLHGEDLKLWDEALERGWTSDEILFMYMQERGINYPNQRVELRNVTSEGKGE